MALLGGCDTAVSELAGEHVRGRLCRQAADECQRGRDEVRPVARGREGPRRGGGNGGREILIYAPRMIN